MTMRVHTWYVQRDVKVAREKKGGREKETELRALRESMTAFRFPGNFRGAYRMGKMRKLSLSTASIIESTFLRIRNVLHYAMLRFISFSNVLRLDNCIDLTQKNVSFIYD